MSILRKNSVDVGSSSIGNDGTPFFHEFKKQASFFLKEKIRSARLVLTDVTPIQLMAEEAINGSPSAPDAQTLGRISKAAFEVDDYWRIVDMMHNTLSRFERKNWRESYNCLIVLERMLTHGPESVAEEFQSDKEFIARMESFQYIDEKGFNWGLVVGKKSERVLKLLQKGPLLKEERDRARKLTRGIQGFGSFGNSSCSSLPEGKDSSVSPTFTRDNSYFNPENQENSVPEKTGQGKTEEAESGNELGGLILKNSDGRTSFKENVEPVAESRPLLDFAAVNGIDTEDYHPFNDTEHRTSASLLT